MGARGLWIEMLCVMHQAEPYGHLVLNGSKIDAPQLARMVGCELREAKRWLAEMEVAGVYSLTAEGVLYSRRMVRDEILRNVRAAGGHKGAEHGAKGAEHGNKGGRPAIQGGDKNPPSEDLRGGSKPPIEPPPSSSVFVLHSAREEKAMAEPPVPRCPHREIAEAYNRILKDCRQVNLKLWSDDRARPLIARWKQFPDCRSLEWWQKFFLWIAESKFLMGQAPTTPGRAPFLLSLDWIANRDNFVKIHEGAYHNDEPIAEVLRLAI